MSLMYVIQCDGDCTTMADFPTPTLTGYRRALRKTGWTRDDKGNDYCPRCTRQRKETTRAPR